MPYLLDINVLIARTDPGHEFHERCLEWEERLALPTFATCPITENGFLRIYGHPNYPGGPGSPEEAKVELELICNLERRIFLADDISLTESPRVRNLKSVAPKHVTDIYLLALAVRHNFQFATLDEGINAQLVRNGKEALIVIS